MLPLVFKAADMNLNIIAYAVYLSLTWLVTAKVGWLCYRNGIYFICEELKDDALARMLNRILLTGYYLVNLGYATVMVYFWKRVNTLNELIETTSRQIGFILFTLGIMHLLNMLLIYRFRKK